MHSSAADLSTMHPPIALSIQSAIANFLCWCLLMRLWECSLPALPCYTPNALCLLLLQQVVLLLLACMGCCCWG
jgi:hypothetical protein